MLFATQQYQWYLIYLCFLVIIHHIYPGPNVSKTTKKSNYALCGWITLNIIFILFFYIYYEYKSVHTEYVPGVGSIYIVIATLGDHACSCTLNELIKNAKYPENIKIGIYQQNEAEDPDCLAMLQYCTYDAEIIHPDLGNITTLCKMKDNIVINRTTVHEGAKGCHYGRHMCMKLQQEESDFIVLVDSHSIFRKHWDEFVMKMWYTIELNREYAVITHYPLGAKLFKYRMKKQLQHPLLYSYHICGSRFSLPPNYMLKNSNGCWVESDVNILKPIRVPYWAGGFNFARSHFWSHVPLDPYIQYVFDGDEMNIATRGWTHGYDFYSPPVDIVGHWYSDSKDAPKRRNPHVRENKEWMIQKDKSEKRINFMWGLLDDINISQAELTDLDKYGLGNKRTIQQYWKFAGINPITKENIVWNTNVYLNGGLEYVPFT